MSANYYTLVASLKEYTLDADTKGFDAQAVVGEIREGISASDAAQVRLLYTCYDCENLVALRAGRATHNPLGNLSREELEQELKREPAQEPRAARPKRLPDPIVRVLEAYARTEEQQQEAAGEEGAIDTAQRFETALFAAWYDVCSHAKSRFLRRWAEFDRTLRNIAAAMGARAKGIPVGEVTVGGGEVVEQLKRNASADFGLRGEVSYIDTLIAAVSDEPNLLEKEHRIDAIRWNEAVELSTFDYFDIDAILSYLVRLNIVARWAQLDAVRGAEMFARLIAGLDGGELMDKMNKQ